MTLQLEEKLLKRKKLGNFRQLRVVQGIIDFCSNDYLGLARSPKLTRSVMQEWQMHGGQLNGLGSTGSRLLTGNTAYAEELENKLAKFHGYEAGLLFNCGYMANVGLLSSIAYSEDTIFFDAAVHASTRDGIRLSEAKAFPFKHNDLEHLESRLRNCPAKGDRFVCVESIYSTDGSKAPLSEICKLSKKYEAFLIVDEAHATGIYGANGQGLIFELGLTSKVYAQVTTFGKALGIHGAVVLGDRALKDMLINFATSCIYTTALPFLSLAAIKCSYDLFPNMHQERSHLQKLNQIFYEAYPHTYRTHIQSLPIIGNNKVKQLAADLYNNGFDVRPLTSPTVQRGKEMLRICLHAFNSESDLKELLHNIHLYGS